MTFEEELIEQVNNLQRCMSEQREDHREQIRDVKGSLYSATQRIIGFKKRITELEKERDELRTCIVNALRVGDLTSNASKMIKVLEEGDRRSIELENN